MNQAPKRNYQKEMDALLQRLEKEGKVPTLFLHSCCAPCSSYVLLYLSKHFHITDFYYNPNITEKAEYEHRVQELKRYIDSFPATHPVTFLEGRYEPAVYLEAVKGLEQEPEGGARCEVCFRLRLEEAARLAAEQKADYFATTLTISPLKNAPLLNAIGEEMGKKYGVAYLPSDFKKKEGYKQSIELSREYDLYRQDYCGCAFSKREREAGQREAGRLE